MKIKKDTLAMLLLGAFLLNMALAIPTGSVPVADSQEAFIQDLFAEDEFTLPAEGLNLEYENENENDLLSSLPENAQDAVEEILEQADPTYPSDFDIGSVLADRDNFYNEIYEPWKSRAAIHAVAYHEETGFLALAGGYLYDNEIHIYRMNVLTGEFDKVWVSGDQLIQSDVMCLAFGDTDLNDFLEIVAGSSDGHVYVFEQRHIYDPDTNTENMFDHVWTSPSMFRVFGLKIEDIDKDYRPDIIAGTWEGIFVFEYDEHSGYPFVEDHWITYREVWSSGPLGTAEDGERVYSLEAGDTNFNGLPEIIAGTREGTIFIYENAGTHIMINGYPFPLVRDNMYEESWTSENYTWNPIMSMDLGELDGTDGLELAVVSQGQGLFVLEWNEAAQTYDYQKVVREFEPWETFGYWGLDRWVDRVISANNVTYHDPLNGSINVDEPIQYVWDEGLGYFLPDADTYPYNTGMARMPDSNVSTFDSSLPGVTNATAIVDWGLDEEGTGSASNAPDVIISFVSLSPGVVNDLNFSISQDGVDFEQISPDRFLVDLVNDELEVDVDDALVFRQWDWFRYAKISVFNNASYDIDALELKHVYNLLTDALSVEIGPLRTDGQAYYDGDEELDKILVGTILGKYIGVAWNTVDEVYEIIWDSGSDERYTAGAGVWDMTHIPTTTNIPIWRFLESPNPTYPTIFEYDLGGNEYNSWSGGVLDPYGLSYSFPNYFVGTQNGQIRVLDTLYQVEDPDITPYIAPINVELATFDMPFTSVEVADFKSISFNNVPAIVVASFDPVVEPYGDIMAHPKAKITFFYRSSFDFDIPFSNSMDMYDVDLNGEISALLAVSKSTPKMRFVDYDGDGDLDMIFSNGELHYARNLQIEKYGEYGEVEFVLIHDEFNDINERLTSGGWGQPDLWDLDEDGDLDIILNYEYKMGCSAFLNEGTDGIPSWKEDRRIFWNDDPTTNMRLRNFTDIRILPTGAGYALDRYAQVYNFDVDYEFAMVAYNNYTNKQVWAEPVYGAIDSYVAATYPHVIRTEFSLLKDTGGDAYHNIGFNVRESWSNDEDLEDWTLSIASGDLDGDGKGEFIVGDYDNNVYVFEHMVDNTYKRMYKTFDLNHNETTTDSPYMYQELEGIDGEFMRKVWDHAEHLLVDVDLDGDGLKELIIASDLQIYVFENENLTGGDSLRFIYSMDLMESSFVGSPGWEYVTGITAMAAGNDLDYDGREELVLGVGPYLFVFNVGVDDFNHTEDYGYFVTSKALEGRYDLPGNPYAEPNYERLWISALAIGDTDQDGYKEIILGGTDDTQDLVPDGFVYIYECQAGVFTYKWSAPSEVTKWNPISDIVLDDQDYDGKDEIIIGHTKGFDIWEWNGYDSSYDKVEYVTASPNYPIIPLRGTLVESAGEYMYNTSHSYRSFSDMAEYTDSVLQVYSNGGRLYWKSYDIGSATWNLGALVTNGLYVTSLTFEEQPSLVAHSNGYIYCTWRVEYNGGLSRIMLARFNPFSETWGTPVELIDGAAFYHPDVFEYDGGNIGIVLPVNLPGTRWLGFAICSTSLPGGYHASGYLMFPGFLNFEIHSGTMVKLPNGDYSLAFSAINTNTLKPDFDIWSITMNSSFNFLDATPHQVTTDYSDQSYPKINYLKDDGSIIIIYEDVSAPVEKRIGLVASQDSGRTWSRPDTLNTIPDVAGRYINPWGTYSYSYSQHSFDYPLVMSPCVLGMEGGGFIYGFMWMFFRDSGTKSMYYQYPQAGINPQSDWASNNLWNVEDLDVGDTDGDGRNEVAAGWEDHVSVYELKSSTPPDDSEQMTYEEVWLSNPYEQPFTALTCYDSNGNGFDEIGIATERGDVFVIEFRNPSEGTVDLFNSEKPWEVLTGTVASPASLFKVDTNADGKDEILYIDDSGSSITLRDDAGGVIWQKSYGDGYTRAARLFDVIGDSLPEIVFYKEATSMFYVLNLITGELIWERNVLAYGDIHGADVADLDGNGYKELVLCSDTGHLLIFNHLGGDIDSHDFGSTIYDVKLGHFNQTDVYTAAFSDSQGRVRVVNLTDWSELYISPTLSAKKVLTVYDFDGDGLDELVFGYEELHILNTSTGVMYYNSTYYGPISNRHFISDFDGDENLEILTQTTEHGIFMEDIVTGVTQWRYQPNVPYVNDISVAYLGGTGLLDVALVGSDGIVVAVDGKSGIAMWFNETGLNAKSVVTVRKGGTNVSSIIALAEFGKLARVERVIPVLASTSPAYVAHTPYMILESGSSTIVDFWTIDMDLDGIDDVLTLDSTGLLTLWKISSGVIWWQYQVPVGIKDVWFGNLSGNAFFDIVIKQGDGDLRIIAGDDPEHLLAMQSPLIDYGIQNVAIANFIGSPDLDEIVILHEKTGDAQLVWYEYLEEELALKETHSQSSPISNVKNKLIVGHFYNYATLDVAIGGYNNEVVVYRGYDGQEMWAYATSGLAVYNLIPGDFNGDAYEDLAYMDSSYDITVLNGNGAYLFGKSYATGAIRQMQAIHLDKDSVHDQLVVNEIPNGVAGYESSGFPVWTFSAPLTLSSHQSYITSGNWGGDAYPDLVFTNYNYLTVINGVDQRALWHFVSDVPIYGMTVGQFAPVGEELMIAFRAGNQVILLSGSAVPPTPPGGYVPPEGSPSSIGQVVSVLGYGLSIAVLVGLPLFFKKQRQN